MSLPQRIEELNDAERNLLMSNVAAARRLVADFAPENESRQFDAGILDRTYAAWLATGESDGNRINQVINAIGSAFGQMLVDTAGFRWVVATDQYGCEMAILALPGRGDVLVYPANLVVKRWESRQTCFLLPLFKVVTQQVRDLEANRPGSSPQLRKKMDELGPAQRVGKRPWWKFWA